MGGKLDVGIPRDRAEITGWRPRKRRRWRWGRARRRRRSRRVFIRLGFTVRNISYF